MTIKIERDAILCVINNHGHGPSSTPSCHKPLVHSPSEDGDCLKREKLRNDLLPLYQGSDFFREAPELDETDDDASTVSSSSCSSVGTAKGVRFADPLVTEVWWRPRTLRRQISSLFYSVEETQRFRQEYREERRLKAQDDPSTSSSGEPGVDSSARNGSQSKSIDVNTSFRISRVVILHKNTRETFVDGEMDISNNSILARDKCKTASDDFFDNDSFWSGEITWY